MTVAFKDANNSLVDLLNRLAVRVQSKRHMLDEFGTIITDAFAAKYISEDFYNYGITDLGMSKRNALRAELHRASLPAKPAQTTPAAMSQEPAMLKSHAELMAAINRSENGLTINELEAELGITTRTLRNRIADLSNQNRIVRVGLGLPGKPYRYCTPDQAGTLEVEPVEAEPDRTEPDRTEPDRPVVTLEEVPVAFVESMRAAAKATPESQREFQPALLNLEQPAGLDLEITAMQTMLAALEPLDDMARSRALGWVSSRLRMS